MTMLETKVKTMWRIVVINKKTGVEVRAGPWAEDKFKAFDAFIKDKN